MSDQPPRSQCVPRDRPNPIKGVWKSCVVNLFTHHPPESKRMSPTLVFCPPHKATTPAMVRKPPTRVMMVQNGRSTTKISLGAPRSSESNQWCGETCVMTPTCVLTLTTHRKQANGTSTGGLCPRQGNCPRGDEKISDTCRDGSQCPINHQDLSGCPDFVRIQPGVCGNLRGDPGMRLFAHHPPENKQMACVVPKITECVPNTHQPQLVGES